MVSLVIGLVVVGAVLVSMLGAGKAGRFQAASAQMNEDAQIALSILARDIQLTGYSRPTGLVEVAPAGSGIFSLVFATVPSTGFIVGCDTGFNDPANSNVCGAGANSAIELVFEADKDTTVLTSAGVPSNCLGNAIAGAAPYVAKNRYFISVDQQSGRPELSCGSVGASGAGTLGTTQPLVENIEQMRILYGTSVPAAPSQIVRYVSATQIAALAGGAQAEWDSVIAVRVCLIVRSAEPVLNAGEDTLTYLNCDGLQQASNDRYMRRAYFTTATLRDKMPS
jgi:type IV pilus assembly protein PilW